MIPSWRYRVCVLRIEDWRDHQSEQPYDAVISVAAFEAFVKSVQFTGAPPNE